MNRQITHQSERWVELIHDRIKQESLLETWFLQQYY